MPTSLQIEHALQDAEAANRAVYDLADGKEPDPRDFRLLCGYLDYKARQGRSAFSSDPTEAQRQFEALIRTRATNRVLRGSLDAVHPTLSAD